MLMHADRRGIEHLQIAVIGSGNSFENPVPYADLPPADEPVVAGRRGTVTLRDLVPRRARAQPPIDAVQHLAVIGTRLASRLVRQKGADDRPFKIRQLVAACSHDSLLPPELESQRARHRYEFMSS